MIDYSLKDKNHSEGLRERCKQLIIKFACQGKALFCKISFLIIVLHPCEIRTSYFVLLLRMSASMPPVRVIALICRIVVRNQ